jgi:hypothetical protein
MKDYLLFLLPTVLFGLMFTLSEYIELVGRSGTAKAIVIISLLCVVAITVVQTLNAVQYFKYPDDNDNDDSDIIRLSKQIIIPGSAVLGVILTIIYSWMFATTPKAINAQVGGRRR